MPRLASSAVAAPIAAASAGRSAVASLFVTEPQSSTSTRGAAPAGAADTAPAPSTRVQRRT
eukprot:607465-Prymnesium_polylepis.1